MIVETRYSSKDRMNYTSTLQCYSPTQEIQNQNHNSHMLKYFECKRSFLNLTNLLEY